ncbi:MAG: hypothetical protein A2Z39_03560 [Deltaproteobacteria bacterium RBG_19FT_COMBO_46_9]|nr:MAG: hypothetical protein A2Z39_03560 [Deltaproteobacteria bacterium RBG_19FT_COMBO_46_9]
MFHLQASFIVFSVKKTAGFYLPAVFVFIYQISIPGQTPPNIIVVIINIARLIFTHFFIRYFSNV